MAGEPGTGRRVEEFTPCSPDRIPAHLGAPGAAHAASRSKSLQHRLRFVSHDFSFCLRNSSVIALF